MPESTAWKKLFIVVLLLAVVVLAGCAPPNDPPAVNAPGFWQGLWDGWTAVFAWIGNLFGGNYGIYNSGASGWYDFGFLLGIGAFTGGSIRATT
jgi:hypothetical protein